MCPDPINLCVCVPSSFFSFIPFRILLPIRLVVNWLWWSFRNVESAMSWSRVKWVNFLVFMDTAYGDKYRLEMWRYSFFFFSLFSPLAHTHTHHRNAILFFSAFLFYSPFNLVFVSWAWILGECACVCVLRASEYQFDAGKFIAFGLNQPLKCHTV